MASVPEQGTEGHRLNRRIIKYVNIVVFSLVTLLVIAVMAFLFAGLVIDRQDEEVAIVVNGYPVTTTEVLDMKAISAAKLAIYLSDIDVISRHAGGGYAEMEELRSALRDKHGIDAGTLLSVILTYAYLTAALEAGHSIPSDSEIAERVRERRDVYEALIEAYEKVLEGNGYTEDGKRVILNEDKSITTVVSEVYSSTVAYPHRLEAEINATGGERFWTEVLPAELKRTLPAVSWREDAFRPLWQEDRHAEIERTLNELRQQALADVQVEIRIPVLNATVEQAFAAMNESEELEEELRRRYPQFNQ